MVRVGMLVAAGWLVVLAGGATIGAQASNEDVARRQLELGRTFLAQGRYAEALRDLKGVAEIHATTSVADDALIEIARYYFDVAGDLTEAAAAVDTVIKKYSTSDSAPDAYLLSGRIALARSHQSPELDSAIADFERVIKVHPNSAAVGRSLQLLGEARWYSRRYNDALADLARVEVEYPTGPAAMLAYLSASRVRVSQGDPISAMEELQHVRDRWPASPEAVIALGRITLLHRLHLRSRSGAAFTLSPDTVGPARLENLASLAASGNAVYWAAESGTGVIGAVDAPKPPEAIKPRGLVLDRSGRPVVIEGGSLRPASGAALALVVPRPNGTPAPLTRISSAAQLSTGDWLVSDEGERGILKFSSTGTFSGVFAPGRIVRLAVSPVDEVAAIDRDQKAVVVFDALGKALARVPLKTTTYEFQNPEDVTFDVFGHLYLLDRTAIAVFSPFPDALPASPDAPGTAAPPPSTFRLLTLYTEPAPGALRRATALAVDHAGVLYVYDERAQRILVYR